jgi:predicted Zn-dependent peptidase
MNNAQGQLVISAPFSKTPEFKDILFNELSSDFQNLKPSSPKLFNGYLPVTDKNVVIRKHNKSQAEIQMGYKFKTSDNLKDSIIFELLNTILGGTPSSRLFSDLREKQKLAYQVNSKLGYFDNSGIMSLYIKTTTDDTQNGVTSYENVQKSINGFNNHIQKLMNENVSQEELESAKLTFKNKILNYSELTSDKNETLLLGLKSFYGISQDNQALQVIDTITVEDIKAAAKYIFNTNPTISIVATENTIENNKNYLSSLGSLVNLD